MRSAVRMALLAVLTLATMAHGQTESGVLDMDSVGPVKEKIVRRAADAALEAVIQEIEERHVHERMAAEQLDYIRAVPEELMPEELIRQFRAETRMSDRTLAQLGTGERELKELTAAMHGRLAEKWLDYLQRGIGNRELFLKFLRDDAAKAGMSAQDIAGLVAKTQESANSKKEKSPSSH